MTDQDQIRAMLDRYEAAVLARDAEAALADYAEDAIGYDLAPPLLHSAEQILDADGMRTWFNTWDGPVRITHPEPTILVDGDLAVAHGLQRMQGSKKGEGESDLWFRYTLALRRSGGAWKIAHIHTSVPMAMDGSGKALTDLKPE
jgi:uncharacterized protein (TIGR02246 family)